MNEHENARLEALRSYEILDTEAEQAFDDITHTIAHICEVPIALISLIDEERQWFKSNFGLDAAETPRDIAFCDVAICDTVPMIVEDANEDHRFAGNPLVTDDPNIRFYAGAPLINQDGFALGTLCAIDRQQRKLTPMQLDGLERLSRLVVHLLEMRRTNRALQRELQGADEAGTADERQLQR